MIDHIFGKTIYTRVTSEQIGPQIAYTLKHDIKKKIFAISKMTRQWVGAVSEVEGKDEYLQA